jgi:hypothetical protein
MWPSAWKQGQQAQTLAEQDRRHRLDLWHAVGLGWLAWVFFLMTVLLLILTVREFMA